MRTKARQPSMCLSQREDVAVARQRMRTWWEGGDIGRPAVVMSAPSESPLDEYPPGHTANRAWMAEGIPHVSARQKGHLSSYLGGSRPRERDGTVWQEPLVQQLAEARLEYDPDNSYWKSTCEAVRRQVAEAGGDYMIVIPSLFEALDTLAQMRGDENLLFDMFDRPDVVHRALRRLTDLYFRYYDVLYDLVRDDIGGSHSHWTYAPGRTAWLQCDFSCMISPLAFGEFMVPVLREMSERISYCVYHLDGPGALHHHDALLSIPGIQVIQWEPGMFTGIEPVFDERWWPLYHKTIEAGKAVSLHIYGWEHDQLKPMRREFGARFHRFLWSIWETQSVEQGWKVLECISD